MSRRDQVAVRQAMGLDRAGEPLPWLGAAVSGGAGALPLVGVLALAAAAPATLLVPFALRVHVAATLGRSSTAVGLVVVLQVLLAGLFMLLLARRCHRAPRRAAVSVGAGFTGAAALLLTAFAAPAAQPIALVTFGGAVAIAAPWAVHAPLLADLYPVTGRVRIVALHWAALLAGGGAAVGGAVALTQPDGLTWRGALLVLAAFAALCTVLATRLRDNGPGSPDQPVAAPAATAGLGFFEAVRRALNTSTLRGALGPVAVIGMFGLPLQLFLLSRLDTGWRLSPTGRGLGFAATLIVAAALVIWLSGPAEARFARDPAGLLPFSARVFAGSAGLLAVGVLLPWPGVGLPLVALGLGGTALLYPAMLAAVLSAVPAAVRLHAGLLLGVTQALAGGGAAVLLMGSVSGRYGPGAAIAVLAVPGWMAAAALGRLGAGLAEDLERRADDVLHGAGDRTGTAEASDTLLVCRGIDFSYGQVQVLFGVDFTVEEGAMVALLGTNGAGKSTLLRVISGLGLPSRGSVSFAGQDITYLDAERRLPLGIAQIPGGRAVFPPLSVVENLRVFGHALAGDRHAVDAGIDATFEAFPRLAERRNQPAATLSGGEQQMLALGKAFLLRPKVLLIDELSLGLAPKIISELLDMVRRINAEGTAIVLVEQSVNIALSLVEHAYFMERGAIRFDGPAAELLERRDLLRSVFLEGAASQSGSERAAGARA